VAHVPGEGQVVPGVGIRGALGRLDRSRHRMVAALAAVLMIVTTWRIGLGWELPAYLVLVAVLVVLSVIDIDTKTLPTPLVWFAARVGTAVLIPAAVLSGEPERIWWAAVGAAGALVALWVLYMASPGGVGFGDVRVGAVLGGHLGWQGLAFVPAGIFLSFVYAAVVGVGLLLARRATRRSTVPFGPFLAAGAMSVILGGRGLVDAVWL
jgi:leader peptidase (prepilin peptidase) / N-methyltransferase